MWNPAQVFNAGKHANTSVRKASAHLHTQMLVNYNYYYNYRCVYKPSLRAGLYPFFQDYLIPLYVSLPRYSRTV